MVTIESTTAHKQRGIFLYNPNLPTGTYGADAVMLAIHPDGKLMRNIKYASEQVGGESIDDTTIWQEVALQGIVPPKIQVQYDTTARTVRTSYTSILPKKIRTREAGKPVALDFFLNLRNDSMSWGGAYVKVYIVTASGSKLATDMGYGNIMSYSAKTIGKSQKRIFCKDELFQGHTEFWVDIKVRSYDNYLYVNKSDGVTDKSHDYGTRVATQTLINYEEL